MTGEKTRGQLIGVTDHCIVRYFERRFGVDIDEIKNEILPDYIRRELTENPDKTNYIIGDLSFRIAEDAIVTCIPLKNEEPLKSMAARKKHERHISNDKRGKNRHIEQKYTKRRKTVKKGRYGK